MTLLASLRPGSKPAPVASEGGPSRAPRTPVQHAKRRRLVLLSAPVVVLLLVLAGRLLTLNLVHEETLAGYGAGDKARTLGSAERQGWVNVVERFRAPFAVGDAHLLSGHYGLARPWFEQAFELVPRGGIEECKVRVNLGLTYEALGDEAKARERTEEWKQFYDKGIAIVSGRPPGCDAPEGGATGQELEDARERMEEKNQPPAEEEPEPQQDGSKPSPTPSPKPTPTPDPERAPSQEQQDALRQQQRQSTIERNLQRGEDDRVEPEGGVGSYPRPW